MNKKSFDIIKEKVGKYFTNKDYITFFFFFAISAALWCLQASRKEFETVAYINLNYKNIPSNFILEERLPEQLRLTVSDKGSTLILYKMHKKSITIDIEKYEGRKYILAKELENELKKKLNTSTEIIKIRPDTLKLKFSDLIKKEVPVKLDCKIECRKGYRICDEIEIRPKKIEVYASQKTLDTLNCVYTYPINIKDAKDTLKRGMSIKPIENVSFVTSSVSYVVKTEKYTEKELDVPIKAINVPSNTTMKCFPSSIKVTFNIGESMYHRTTPSNFKATVDYEEVRKKGIKKAPVHIECSIKSATDIRLSEKNVDYLLENIQ